MGLDLPTMGRTLRTILRTLPHELTCDECLGFLDSYAELELAGGRPAEAMPLVYHHLGICRDCYEEYQGLLSAMRGLA
ncbi:MAG: hypothetical protein H5T69_09030 [Chloroflexi bacterium]|nr:hypothetical protein [Chloroflexota bacterium]